MSIRDTYTCCQERLNVGAIYFVWMKAMQDLPSKLGMVDATAIVIGIVIGSGIFVLPNLIARSLPSASGDPRGVGGRGRALVFRRAGVCRTGRDAPGHRRPVRVPSRSLRDRHARSYAAGLSCWRSPAGGSAWLAVTFSIYAGYFIPLTRSHGENALRSR